MTSAEGGAGATWAGTHVFTAPAIVEALTIDDVRDAVAAGGRVRALGTRHSFNDLADIDGTLVTVTGISADPVLDESRLEVTVGAGTRYGVLARWLEDRGWALHNLGSLPHISIGGAIATGTHGSGHGNGVLTTAVRRLEYVDASGMLAEVRVGDPDFAALAVGLGAFGVVVRVTLAIEPSYRMRQDVYSGLTWETFLADPDAVTGAAYSVSVFTTWGDEVGDIWLKSRLDAFGGISGAQLQTETAPLVGSTENLTEQLGVPGPWCERLPHFRLDATPSNGDEIQSEYFVARSDAAAALTAVRQLADDIRPHLLVSELRTVRADDLWLSGAYGRDTLAIHFTWANHPEAVRTLLPRIEAVLAPFDARPHWGKWHTMSADAVAAVVPRLADARAVFERLDPEARFANAHLRRLGVR
ncbi:D-arabinono-1,4-lactone oxidase [Pseudolysinimonas sp.]|uniref:D-arabinono-1,4-lactone oxidase n=1 Tax=Pseudolysinimonas sp. TaxID=2680009 RepID=UPI00286AB4B4|nr:D-arabinono-1,4-lactone oxidase [Pseudolysinimonas sp.]